MTGFPNSRINTEKHRTYLLQFLREVIPASLQSSAATGGSVSPQTIDKFWESIESWKSFGYWSARHSITPCIYWCVGGLLLLADGSDIPDLPEDLIAKYLTACYDVDRTGFAGCPGGAVTPVSTLSALQVLSILGEPLASQVLSEQRREACQRPLREHLNQFSGLVHGERLCGFDAVSMRDLRNLYSTVYALRLLGAADLDLPLVDDICSFVMNSQRLGSGFGMCPNAAAHAGYTFCGVALLKLLGRLDAMIAEKPSAFKTLGQWLSGLQSGSDGGIAGRYGKTSDVCYAWWTSATVRMLQDAHAPVDNKSIFEASKIVDFITHCEDHNSGGIGARVKDDGDVYHTFFALAALDQLESFTGEEKEGSPQQTIFAPELCLPRSLCSTIPSSSSS
eukprot:Clim_evm32s153 gene=Clim_evmTU32s153